MTTLLRTISLPTEETDVVLKKRAKSPFPKEYDHAGWLDIRTNATKPWKRKYFVLANNFLLMLVTPYSLTLERVIPLEGSNIKSTTKTSSMTFEILVRRKRFQFRSAHESDCNKWTMKIERASKLKIRDVYSFQQILGTNVSGSTKVIAAINRVTGDEVAVKVISKREYDPLMLANEVLILKRLSHPNVVSLYNLFETRNSVYIVMEKCNGGELFEQIAALDGGGFSETQCVNVLHQIAKAVKYMHSMGIVHRDLKPENILCTKPNSIQEIKITDFGISKVIFDPNKIRKQRLKNSAKNMRNATIADMNEEKQQQKNKILGKASKWMRMKCKGSNSNNRKGSKKEKIHHSFAKKIISPKKHRMSNNFISKKKSNGKQPSLLQYLFDEMTTVCGTLSYTAPEILKGRPYDNRVDYWSVGVIAYILLCGYPPFYGDTEMEVAQSILNSDVNLEDNDWGHVSEGGKRLVIGLLNKNPKHRLTTDHVLSHTWLFASKEVSKKARVLLRRTIDKRKKRNMNMSAFEMKSKSMNYINETILDMNRVKSRSCCESISNYTSDSGSILRYSLSSTDIGRYSNMIEGSMNITDDDLFELRLPHMSLTPRASDSIGIEMDDDEYYSQYGNDDGNVNHG